MASRVVARRLAACATRRFRGDNISFSPQALRTFASAPACQFGENANEGQISGFVRIPHLRHMSGGAQGLPSVSDPQVKKALATLYVNNWAKIDDGTKKIVESTLAKHRDEVLLTSWQSAQAVEQFAAKLIHLRMELDELSGGKFGGEDVAEIPEPIVKALKSAFARYSAYLYSIDERTEGFLKKKVELDLGSLMLQVKQRCNGLEAEWGEIGVLGTSGLAGSYIEKFAQV